MYSFLKGGKQLQPRDEQRDNGHLLAGGGLHRGLPQAETHRPLHVPR